MEEENLEELGLVIDELENLSYSINMDIPDRLHVESMRSLIPKLHERLHKIWIAEGGDIDKDDY